MKTQGTNGKQGASRKDSEAHWLSLIGRRVYFYHNGFKNGSITDCYVVRGRHYVDIKLDCGTKIEGVHFATERAYGNIRLYKQVGEAKPKTSSIKTRATISNREIAEIFEEEQDELEANGYSTRTSAMEVFNDGEDDRESSYYETSEDGE